MPSILTLAANFLARSDARRRLATARSSEMSVGGGNVPSFD
jgi:hypothetical protein